MGFSLEISSVQKVLQNSEQVLVYGFGHCEYEEVLEYLAFAEDSPVKHVLSDRLGDPEEPIEERSTWEGTLIEQVSIEKGGPKFGHRIDKAGLTNLVFENYKRQKEGLPIIPILFTLDIDNNEYETSAKTITSREESLNQLRTHSELRRAYKLVQEFGAVAEKSFRFVKLNKIKGCHYSVTQIPAPWKDPDWVKCWSKRKLTSGLKEKKDHWKKQISEFKKRFDQLRIDRIFADLITLPQEYAGLKPLFVN